MYKNVSDFKCEGKVLRYTVKPNSLSIVLKVQSGKEQNLVLATKSFVQFMKKTYHTKIPFLSSTSLFEQDVLLTFFKPGNSYICFGTCKNGCNFLNKFISPSIDENIFQHFVDMRRKFSRRYKEYLSDSEFFDITLRYTENDILKPIDAYFRYQSGRNVLSESDGSKTLLDKFIIDKLARSIGTSFGKRIKFHCYTIIERNKNNGHSCIDLATLYSCLIKEMDDCMTPIERKTLLNAIEQGGVLDILRKSEYFVIYRGNDNIEYIYQRITWNKETEVLNFIINLISNDAKIKRKRRSNKTDVTKDELLTSVEYLFNCERNSFTREQMKAIDDVIELLLNEKKGFYILTGLPGTGKSFVVNILTCIASLLQRRICLCAPTGKASQKMSTNELKTLDGEKIKPVTIHKAISSKNKEDEYMLVDSDFIIVDEVSLLDLDLSFEMIKTISSKDDNKKKIVIFVGDPNQIPSIGHGNILKALLDTKCIPFTFLTEVKRQHNDSRISLLARNILMNPENAMSEILTNQGKCSDIESFVNNSEERSSSEEIKRIHERICEIYKKYKEKCFIITPYKNGDLGSEKLNNLIHTRFFNCDERSRSMFSFGERVMIMKNIYRKTDLDKIIMSKGGKTFFNGEMGFYERDDDGDPCICLTTPTNKKKYLYLENYDDVGYGHAATIHKMQGSDHPVIILILHSDHDYMLNRQLLYTAVTRAKKKLIILGNKAGLITGLKEAPKRVEFLRDRFCEIYSEQ